MISTSLTYHNKHSSGCFIPSIGFYSHVIGITVWVVYRIKRPPLFDGNHTAVRLNEKVNSLNDNKHLGGCRSSESYPVTSSATVTFDAVLFSQ